MDGYKVKVTQLFYYHKDTMIHLTESNNVNFVISRSLSVE